MEDWPELLLFIFVSIFVSVLINFRCRYFFLALPIAAVLSTFVLLLIDYVSLGYMDPFVPIAIPFLLAYTAGVAFVVGIPFWIVRRIRSFSVEQEQGSTEKE